MAGILTLTAGGAVAVFSAGAPGESVTPRDGADLLVGLVQSQESILWTSIAGPVSTVMTLGWPSTDGTHDLGGALVIEAPANTTAGTLDIGEPPKSLLFSFEN